MASATFDLNRFVEAQRPIFDSVVDELRHGRKRSHWMWFVFPQMRGLGHSTMAEFYGIGSLDEACAYLDHRLLGQRLLLCTQSVLEIPNRSLSEIFGSPDDMKFRSSMTLFALAAREERTVFSDALDHYCGGEMDQRTLELMDGGPNAQ